MACCDAKYFLAAVLNVLAGTHSLHCIVSVSVPRSWKTCNYRLAPRRFQCAAAASRRPSTRNTWKSVARGSASSCRIISADRLLVPEANRVLTRHIGAVGGGLREICDEETKQGHLQKVEVLHQEVRGDVAQVRYMLYYADGSAIEDSQGLVVGHWVWKISP